MSIAVEEVVMLPDYAPYPRYGRVVSRGEAGVHVTDVYCGDPRCAAEHQHGAQTWANTEICHATAYQPQAPWEHNRYSSPHALL